MLSCPPDRIAAFAAFFRAHFTYVHQNLRRLGVPPGAVEDAAQEVFLVVLRHADAPITNVRGWLFGIVRRIAWRFRRGASRRDRLVQALTHEPPVVGDDDAQLLEREAAELLERFLARLDDDKRAVFVLAELEQQTAGEIASALGIKENTVYSRLRAARQEFDRSCARLRLRDQREALLGRGRRAHAPSPATRERVLAALLVPGLWGMSAGAAAATPATHGGGVFAGLSAVASAPQVATLTAVLLGVLGGATALLDAGRARAGAAEVSAVEGRGGGEDEDVLWDRLVAGAEERAVAGGWGGSEGREASPDRSRASAARAAVLQGEADDGRSSRSRAVAGKQGGVEADAGRPGRARMGAGAREGGAERAGRRGRAGQAGGRGEQDVRATTGAAPTVGAGVPGDRSESGAITGAVGVATEKSVAEDMSAVSAAPRSDELAPADATTPGARGSEDLAREAGLIAEARRAIRERAWDRAIALLAAHAREFPGGTLRDERWLSQIVATCASGQVEAARAEIERLARERPALARKAAPLCPGGALPRPEPAPGE
ncbi:sigma-70 family RNA polymerase sigma factor [Nannocystis sp. ILAH1]|uniref:RNA polymerase sigma factor n=1 Tax=Nannocystis sp. ILAH1 TaxID=2996789 RepID=UPI00226E00A8|nr:sigma-70 family RNA polymerase sigma factor [Nannocystis sp. ILAH1]MCY0989434.1 sigma-70 family RNA polymerase sigma factor [Nannocystis sp. ILAH1]